MINFESWSFMMLSSIILVIIVLSIPGLIWLVWGWGRVSVRTMPGGVVQDLKG
jgi:hypothetical protein